MRPDESGRLARRAGWRAAALFATLLAACGESDSPTAPGPPPPPPPGPGPELVLASTELVLPAALSRGDAGEHESYFVAARVRPDLGPTAGARLIVTLQDVSRPGLACASDEPEDGCATVDWSGDPADPRVPAGGVFLNRLRLELASGARDYFLSRTLRLAEVPDLIDPNRQHTAIGGVELRWESVLATDLRPGSDLELRLVMTKWQPPQVRIRVQVLLQPAS
ncbi:MAG: hypothetical protein R3325_15685 [Thermoanaerobaculia bacterium]|nr:hypothetical protein [Thermoanaerobaculia bacterium]